MDYSPVFWVKFIVISLLFMVLIWKMGGSTLSTSWRVMFTLTAPVGVFFAIAGKSVGKSHSVGGL